MGESDSRTLAFGDGLPAWYFGKTTLDAAREMSAGQLHVLLHLARRRQRIHKLLRLGNVAEKLLHGKHAIRRLARRRQSHRHPLVKIVNVTHQEVVLVAVMRVEGRTADVR